MSALAEPHSLASVVSRPVEDRVGMALRRVAEVEAQVRALVAEDARLTRLGDTVDDLDRTLLWAAVPIGVKDNISVEGLPTRAGSKLPAESFAMPEASAVGALRSAGCVVLGKTETTELAFADPAPTANPHDLARTPGGSSSGSAASVAAGYVPLALGTQTVDSTITPAAYCGVVGFKPTWGRFPLDGVVPFAPSLDHLGLMAADVDSVAAAARAIDHTWAETPKPQSVSLGVCRGPLLEEVAPEPKAGFEAQIRVMEENGARLVEAVPIEDPEKIRRDHYRAMAGEFAAWHRPLFEEHEARYRPRIRQLIQKGLTVSASETADALAAARRLRDGFSLLASSLRVDAFVCPSATGPAPEGHDYIGDPAMSIPWTSAGLPCVSLPAGLAPTPIGLQLVGGFGLDEPLLALAGWVEEALDQPPGGR